MRDPSMTGAQCVVVAVAAPAHGSDSADVKLRYFRSNGVPYEFAASLRLRQNDA